MKTNIKSVLTFDNYIVKEINYKANVNFSGENKVKLDFDIEDDIRYITDDCMEVELSVVVFPDAYKNNYPYEMKVSLVGVFGFESSTADIRAFETNAIAILFPYLRSLVSTYTINANMGPVILPAMNINAYLKNKK